MANRRKETEESLPPKNPSPVGFSIKGYEKSKVWRDKSKVILDNKDCKCAICGRARWKKYKKKTGWKRMLRFSVHHLTYRDIPNETPEQLMTLCHQCHTLSHEILRMKHIAPFYLALAKVVYKFGFKYDRFEEDTE